MFKIIGRIILMVGMNSPAHSPGTLGEATISLSFLCLVSVIIYDRMCSMYVLVHFFTTILQKGINNFESYRLQILFPNYHNILLALANLYPWKWTNLSSEYFDGSLLSTQPTWYRIMQNDCNISINEMHIQWNLEYIYIHTIR